MALIVPPVVRYTVHGSTQVRPWACIVDMGVVESLGQNRSDAIHDLAGEIINGWAENILTQQSNEVTLDSVSWVDLATADGETGARASTSDHTLPESGGNASASSTPSVAYLVRKVTSGGRSTRDGRMYVPGLPESHSNEGGAEIDSSYLAQLQSLVEAFKTRIEKPGTANYASSWRVVHTVKGREPTATTVNSVIVEQRLATQRRRLRK